MEFVARWTKPILLISGVLTFSMVFAVVAPQAMMASLFGQGFDEPLAEIVVRNWGGLIAAGGLMLIWAAFRPPVRPMVLIVVGGTKVMFIALVLSYGRAYLGHQIGPVIAMDAVWVILFALCLASIPRAGS